MTPRERILSVLSGDLPDRVPVCLFVQQEYLSYHYGRQDTHRVRDGIALARELGFDALTRDTFHIEPFYTRRSYPNWQVDKQQTIQDGIVTRSLSITTPQGVLTQREAAPYDPATVAGIHFTTQEYLLSDLERAFPVFRQYMPSPGLDYIQEMRQHARWAQALMGDAGLNCPWGSGGVYNLASSLRGLEALLCDPYEDEALYAELMSFITQLVVRDYLLLCNETDYSIVGLQGNIASGGMMGNDFFQAHVMPYEEQVLEAIRSAGRYSLYHNCGFARGLYPAYGQMHMTVFETLSAPPQGDNSLAEAKALLGREKVLSGNLDQIQFLKSATPREVVQATRAMVEVGKPGGRYLFATSDYLERDTPLENIMSMIRAAQEAGMY